MGAFVFAFGALGKKQHISVVCCQTCIVFFISVGPFRCFLWFAKNGGLQESHFSVGSPRRSQLLLQLVVGRLVYLFLEGREGATEEAVGKCKARGGARILTTRNTAM